jgi:hypothetical protein
MALKLRRQAGMFTNESLQHRTSRCHLDLLRTGAVSFKRVLDISGVHSQVIGNSLYSADW